MAAADIPLKAQALKPVCDRTGFYVAGQERIPETYCAHAVNKDLAVTADYPLVANPAYNAGRGLASAFSGRPHSEF